LLSAVNADSVIADGVLSSSNTDSAATVELPQAVMVNVNAAAIKATVFFPFMIKFLLFAPIFVTIPCRKFQLIAGITTNRNIPCIY